MAPGTLVTYCPWPSVLSRRQKGLATLGRVPVSQMPQGAWLRCERGQQSCPCPRCQQDSAAIPAPPRATLLQHPGLYSKARQGETALQRGTKTKTNRSMGLLGFFFFLFSLHSRPSSQPLPCHPRWNASPNSSLARCVLLPALPLIVCSDCAFPTLGIMARDRRGSVPAPHHPQRGLRAQAGAKRAPGAGGQSVAVP